MEISYRLAQLVFYDDYDTCGYLLAIKDGVLVELDERDTCILNALLTNVTLPEVVQHLAKTVPVQSSPIGEAEVIAFVKRLQEQQLIEPGRNPLTRTSLRATLPQSREESPTTHISAVTWRQRLQGAGHIIMVIGELCTSIQGLYHAHQYLWKLKEHCPPTIIATASAIELVRKEYWFYRLVVGLFERRAAYLIGQTPGNEGLCLIRSLALCAYLLSLGIPATVVIARPCYGSRDGFKLHVWVELMNDGTPLNERPNIGDGYRQMYAFPLSS